MRISLFLIPVILAGSASAQSMNVNFGGVPPSGAAYGGVAGQYGEWNGIGFIALTASGVDLFDLDGQATAATLGTPDAFGAITGCTLVPGDLGWIASGYYQTMNFQLVDPIGDLEFSDLENGWYQVYVYSKSFCVPQTNEITVVGSPEPTVTCVEQSWTGRFLYGQSYARHKVEVTDGTLTVQSNLPGMGFSLHGTRMNAIQLVFQGSEEILGTTTCWDQPLNSSGESATLDLVGNSEVLFDNVEFRARALPVNAPLVFLASRDLAPLPAAVGLGTFCLGSNWSTIGPVLDSGPMGEVGLHVAISDPDSNPMISIVAGETWHFQTWFRDPGLGWTANLSDAVSVTFQ